jgi:hypothetical protein
MDRALQEELGLKAEGTKGLVKVLVINHIDKPSEKLTAAEHPGIQVGDASIDAVSENQRGKIFGFPSSGIITGYASTGYASVTYQ